MPAISGDQYSPRRHGEHRVFRAQLQNDSARFAIQCWTVPCPPSLRGEITAKSSIRGRGLLIAISAPYTTFAKMITRVNSTRDSMNARPKDQREVRIARRGNRGGRYLVSRGPYRTVDYGPFPETPDSWFSADHFLLNLLIDNK